MLFDESIQITVDQTKAAREMGDSQTMPYVLQIAIPNIDALSTYQSDRRQSVNLNLAYITMDYDGSLFYYQIEDGDFVKMADIANACAANQCFTSNGGSLKINSVAGENSLSVSNMAGDFGKASLRILQKSVQLPQQTLTKWQ
jgi:exopolysaccharide biosynthesis protein